MVYTNKFRISGDPGFWSEDQLRTVVKTEFRNMSRNFEATISEGHPYRLLGKGSRDIGGSFHNTKVSVDHIAPLVPQRINAGNYSDYGLLVAEPRVAGLLQYNPDPNVFNEKEIVEYITSLASPMSVMELNGLGATAVSRCIPTNPVVDLSTSIAEFISAKKFFSLPGTADKLSGEYLNVMLGILPVVQDVKDLHTAITTQEEVLKQYERDSGRPVRRRYEFPVTRSVSTETQADAFPAYHGAGSLILSQMSRGPRTTVQTVTNKTWFSGSFTYYLPKHGWRRTAADLGRVYGLQPGVDTAWNLLPYSFIADYFANMGDVLHNVDAFSKDGLVMPYGYIMNHRTTVRDTIHECQVTNAVGQKVPVTLRSRLTYESKQRMPANPFGFGVDSDGLSARQTSILAALGLNRR